MSVLARLRDHGLRVHLDAGQLLVAPRSALTDELRALIRSQKGSILNELADALDTQRAKRQAKVEADLQANPDLRVAFDVADVPLNPGSGRMLSVVLATRHHEHILSGELHIPRERWDMSLFLRTVDRGSERPS